MEAQLQGPSENVRMMVPVLAQEARVSGGPGLSGPEDIFFLTGGFCADEYTVIPDETGYVWIQIAL